MVILATLLLGLCISVFAEEAPSKLEVGDYLNISYLNDGSWRTPHLRAVNMNFNKMVQVQRIEPAAAGLCRVTYSTGLTEYIKKGDVFYYRPEKSAPGVGSYMCTVDSFDYDKISFRIEESSLTAIHFENKD